MSGIRIDKWLWAARFFKSRALATAACDAGHVVCNGGSAKPSRILEVGDRLQIKNEGGDYAIELLVLTDQRGSAAIARTLYSEGVESCARRAALAAERRALLANDPLAAATRGRPSKRDRRLIHSFRGHF